MARVSSCTTVGEAREKSPESQCKISVLGEGAEGRSPPHCSAGAARDPATRGLEAGKPLDLPRWVKPSKPLVILEVHSLRLRGRRAVLVLARDSGDQHDVGR